MSTDNEQPDEIIKLQSTNAEMQIVCAVNAVLCVISIALLSKISNNDGNLAALAFVWLCVVAGMLPFRQNILFYKKANVEGLIY